MTMRLFAHLFACSGLLMLFLPVMAEQAQRVTTEDGRQVQLNADGSWSYIQRDRYATNAKGERFILSPNGRWKREAPPSGSPASKKNIDPSGKAFGLNVNVQTADQPAAEPVEIMLRQVTVKRSQSKALKSVRTDSETHFIIDLHNQALKSLDLGTLDNDAFSVETSRGRALKVKRVVASQSALSPGQRAEITVVCSSSPRWKSIEYLRLSIQPGAIGNQRSYILDRSLRDVEFIKVQSL